MSNLHSRCEDVRVREDWADGTRALRQRFKDLVEEHLSGDGRVLARRPEILIAASARILVQIFADL